MPDTLQGYPLRAFVICLIAYTTAQMDLALFGYAVPAIRAEFGLALSEVMAIVSMAFLLGGVLLVFLGWLADRVGRLPLFQFSLLGSSALVALISVAPGVMTLTALRGASIAVGGLSYPITGAIITEEMPARLRGLFMGLLQIGYPLGWALASLWSMWILTEYGWRQLFWVGLVSLPMVWVVRRYLREPPRSVAARSEQAPPAFADLFAKGIRERALTLFAAQFLFVWAYAASIFLFPSFLREVRALDAFNFSLLIGAGNAIGVIGYVLAAWVGERIWTRRNTVVLWTVLGSILFQVLVWVPETFLSDPIRVCAHEHVFLWFCGGEVRLPCRSFSYSYSRAGNGLLRIAGSHIRLGSRALQRIAGDRGLGLASGLRGAGWRSLGIGWAFVSHPRLAAFRAGSRGNRTTHWKGGLGTR